MFTNLRKNLSTAMVTAGAMVATSMPALAADIDTPPGFFMDFDSLIGRILRVVLAVAALLVFLYLIWGGIEWITSGGDKGKTESARNKITAAVLGLIILAASYAILLVALKFIGVDSLESVLEEADL